MDDNEQLCKTPCAFYDPVFVERLIIPQNSLLVNRSCYLYNARAERTLDSDWLKCFKNTIVTGYIVPLVRVSPLNAIT